MFHYNPLDSSRVEEELESNTKYRQLTQGQGVRRSGCASHRVDSIVAIAIGTIHPSHPLRDAALLSAVNSTHHPLNSATTVTTRKTTVINARTLTSYSDVAFYVDRSSLLDGNALLDSLPVTQPIHSPSTHYSASTDTATNIRDTGTREEGTNE